MKNWWQMSSLKNRISTHSLNGKWQNKNNEMFQPFWHNFSMKSKLIWNSVTEHRTGSFKKNGEWLQTMIAFPSEASSVFSNHGWPTKQFMEFSYRSKGYEVKCPLWNCHISPTCASVMLVKLDLHREVKGVTLPKPTHTTNSRSVIRMPKVTRLLLDPYFSCLQGLPTKKIKQLPKQTHDPLAHIDNEPSSEEDLTNSHSSDDV